jgi:hypothetical protein
VRNGWYSQRYEPEFISGCGTDCSACGGREKLPKHKASKVAERRFIRNVSREREGRLADVNEWKPKTDLSQQNKWEYDHRNFPIPEWLEHFDEFQEIRPSLQYEEIASRPRMGASSLSIKLVDQFLQGDGQDMALFGRWRLDKDAPLPSIKDASALLFWLPSRVASRPRMDASSLSINLVDQLMQGDGQDMALFGRWRLHKDAPLPFIKDTSALLFWLPLRGWVGWALGVGCWVFGC